MRQRVHGAGFTYLGVLLLVALLGAATAVTLRLGASLQRRDAEIALLEIGNEFREALLSYANATSTGQPRFPATLQELLKDSRFPTTVRHLRKIYIDPLTGRAEWGLIYAPNNLGIIGVYSLAKGRPIKIGHFAPPFQGFYNKTSYQDWKFMLPPEAFIPIRGL